MCNTAWATGTVHTDAGVKHVVSELLRTASPSQGVRFSRLCEGKNFHWANGTITLREKERVSEQTGERERSRQRALHKKHIAVQRPIIVRRLSLLWEVWRKRKVHYETVAGQITLWLWTAIKCIKTNFIKIYNKLVIEPVYPFMLSREH